MTKLEELKAALDAAWAAYGAACAAFNDAWAAYAAYDAACDAYYDELKKIQKEETNG
jgi:thioesterase domain-containing protein